MNKQARLYIRRPKIILHESKYRIMTRLDDSQSWSTAPVSVRSRYSRYMLCVPERESYLSQMA